MQTFFVSFFMLIIVKAYFILDKISQNVPWIDLGYGFRWGGEESFSFYMTIRLHRTTSKVKPAAKTVHELPMKVTSTDHYFLRIPCLSSLIQILEQKLSINNLSDKYIN